jgi:hypothetical protein
LSFDAQCHSVQEGHCDRMNQITEISTNCSTMT